MKVYILNVGTSLNLKKPENNWLVKDHMEEEDNYTYLLFKKDNGSFFVASSYGNCHEDIEKEFDLIADQSGRNLGNGKVIFTFSPKTIQENVVKIKELTGKSSFSFYVYK